METSILLLIAIVAFFFLFSYLIPIRLFLAALFSGAYVSLFTLVGMRLRRVSAEDDRRAADRRDQAGLDMDVRSLESHYLAEGNVATWSTR